MVKIQTPRGRVPAQGPNLGGGLAQVGTSVPEDNYEMSRCQFYSYAIGHVLNDMCASCCDEAAGVLLAGQVADAIATPLVGIFSDQSEGCARFGFGRRKCWYLFGSLGAALCFFFVFGECLPCLGDGPVSQTWLVIYYCAAASLFNVGWAAVQVSHMSMLPELTPDDTERVSLNSARYAFTVLSNVAVFIIFFVLIQTVGGGGDVKTSTDVPFEKLFRLLAFACLALGGLCSIIFLSGTEELIKNSRDTLLADYQSSSSSISEWDSPVPTRAPRNSSAMAGAGESTTLKSAESSSSSSSKVSENSSLLRQVPSSTEIPGSSNSGYGAASTVGVLAEGNSIQSAPERSRWQDWLYVREFYQVGWIYMATRLVVNVSQVLIPFYLLDYLNMPATSITIIPLVLYIAQFLATFVIKGLTALTGRRGTLLIGSALVFAACVAFWFLQSSHSGFVYPVIVSLGVGCAIVMVVSQQLQADLVGVSTASGAFVYGAHSFADKLSNGVAIFVIQKINGDAMTYVRDALVFVPAASMLLALLFTYLLDLDQLSGVAMAAESTTKQTASISSENAGTPRSQSSSPQYKPIATSHL